MDTTESLKVLRALADGVNPVTGEVFPDESPYQHPQIIRSLFKAVDALEGQITRDQRRQTLPSNAGKSWSDDEDRQLAAAFRSGSSIADLARTHQRTRGAIQSRLERLGLVEQPQPEPAPRP